MVTSYLCARLHVAQPASSPPPRVVPTNSPATRTASGHSPGDYGATPWFPSFNPLVRRTQYRPHREVQRVWRAADFSYVGSSWESFTRLKLPLRPYTLPEAFPIKASDKPKAIPSNRLKMLVFCWRFAGGATVGDCGNQYWFQLVSYPWAARSRETGNPQRIPGPHRKQSVYRLLSVAASS